MHIDDLSEDSTTPSTPSCQHDGEDSLLSLAAPSSRYRNSGHTAESPTTEDYILSCALVYKKVERKSEMVVILSDSDILKAKAKGEVQPLLVIVPNMLHLSDHP